jgi:hypothetical protein
MTDLTKEDEKHVEVWHVAFVAAIAGISTALIDMRSTPAAVAAVAAQVADHALEEIKKRGG